ncbi:MAG TPA: dephospho-CoA kinase [Candidatus Acidoferrum sp.]|nr:dephospho-CoA kinase [Candidatus Acidoferrum sp.]
MLKLGLTGGIASGKSFVAACLREMHFRVLDADQLGHKLLEPGQSAYEPVVQEFGDEILRPDKSVDRKKLGAIVFADPQKLARLNSILHPRIEQAMRAQFAEWEKENPRDAVFVEAALLVEAGMHTRLDGLVVVWCNPEQQIERLLARGLTEAEARRRIALQLPNDEKLKHATDTIDTSGTIEATQAQVASLAKTLRSGQN